MKTQTYIMMAVILLVCFAAGCSTTRNINTQTGLQTIEKEPFTGETDRLIEEEEPFISEIKRAATKRSKNQANWYFLGNCAKHYDWPKRFDFPVRTKEQIECVPIILCKF